MQKQTAPNLFTILEGIKNKSELPDPNSLNNFNDSQIDEVYNAIEERIISLEKSYRPIKFGQSFSVIAPAIYNQEMDEIKRQLDRLKEYLRVSSLSNSTGGTEGKKPKNIKVEHLVSLFEHTSKYKAIMGILENEEKIQNSNNFWRDLQNGHKTELASLIKHLQIKGYYKENKMPSENEIKAICKNTFGIDVGLSTIQHAKPTNFPFKYIPFATTLPSEDK